MVTLAVNPVIYRAVAGPEFPLGSWRSGGLLRVVRLSRCEDDAELHIITYFEPQLRAKLK